MFGAEMQSADAMVDVIIFLRMRNDTGKGGVK